MNSNNPSSKGRPQSRRWFMQTAAAGGGAALLSTLPFKAGAFAFPQTKPVNLLAKSASELELESMATSHPVLHGLATEAVARAKYTFMATAAGHAGSGNELADVCRAFLASRKPKKRAGYQSGAQALLAAPQATRDLHFGRYSNIAASDFLKMDHATVQTAARLPLGSRVLTEDDLGLGDFEREAAEWAKRQAEEKASEADKKRQQEDLQAGRRFTNVEFMITEVLCKEDTGDRWGADDIALGGVATGAHGGHIKVPRWLDDEQMDSDHDHNTRRWRKGRKFAEFPIRAPELPNERVLKLAKKNHIKLNPNVPVSFYAVGIGMAELDDGGFDDFLDGLWKAVGGWVSDELGDVVVGAGVGELIPIPGLGMVIGAAIGAIIGAIAEALRNDDDMVGHKTLTLALYHETESYYKSKEITPHHLPVVMNFKETGWYQVTGGWRLVNPDA
jgi:hypothetical protein